MRWRVPAALAGTGLLFSFAGVATGDAAQAKPDTASYGSASQNAPVVVARGLNNPRQVSITPLGSLLVAEAGTGGAHCLPFGESGGLSCLGMTGSISFVPNPRLSTATTPIRLVTGLLSVAAPNGAAATGASGMSAGHGKIYFVMTGVPPVELPPDLDTSMSGKLMGVRPPASPRVAADLQAYETANDPDNQGPESAPYQVLALRDRVLVADAAGNDVLQLRDGRLSTFAVLPNVQDGACAGRPNENGTTGCDAVPTGLAVGRDGSIYVGGLGGFTPGAGHVYKLNGRTGRIEKQWTGLTAVNGVAVGPDGSVYASQLFTAFGPAGPDFATGKVTRIRPDGTRTDTAVPAPAGLAVAGHSLYVSAWSTSPGGGLGVPGTDSSGQVWRLRI
ncbi:MAG: hypothetical protein V7637_3160 [Mycobacteriales bacterium]